ncbi:hypothetical protein NGRA_2112 [Nosema granulosis]|uniref:CCAAT-binding factor domain-containing protein n=1 Tax=Nosema granulosis TaxID=83296 RepID=A0A9P6H0H5_9MICR|nr:hypothetical protein NGRA_2112 [Nosema granulosis]
MIRFSLKQIVREGDKGEILGCLKEIASAQPMDDYQIDDLLVKSYFILEETHLKEFVELLYDLLVHMRDPRNVIVLLLKNNTSDTLPLFIYKFIYFVMKNYDFKFNGFYEKLMKSDFIDEESLYFLATVLHNNDDLSASFMRDVVKKLLSRSLETSSQVGLDILYTILFILRSNPVLYSFILEERSMLEMHLESIEEIASVARMIKREAENKKNRVKFVNIASMKYPKIKC